MLSLNPVDWLEVGVRLAVEAFERGMTELATRILKRIPQRPRRKSKPG